ncbi:PAS domain S-box protein [Allocoleopsis franciscana]|uniref:histidine kinase n=1 Tax=Allocoleopsis franciscana PCC 7113 TaxID=1173027 RepID=K9WB63_9CYAN|nr:PAS domain S-box protein [Allocoleopsis franciscana]AFZ17051.1 PAS domain S-box [Allocoleopsis franciscana PCC 7113]
MTRLNLDDFAKQIQDWCQRLAQLQQLTGESPSTPQQQEIILTAVEGLSTAFEELQVANEELYQQHEKLLMTQQALIAERQRYQQLFEFAPDAYLVTDVNGVIQEANRAAATRLNHSQQFLVGKPLACYVVKEERRAFRNQLNQLRQVEGVQEWEVSLRSPDQTPLITALRVGTIQSPEGQPMGFRWLMRDITEHKRIELELRQAHERLHLAANALDGIIYDWNVENGTVDRTQGLVEVLGYRPEEAQPTLDWWTQFIHPDDRQPVRQVISNALANSSAFDTEYRIRDKNYQYLHIWDRGQIIRNASGRAVRVVGSTLNISGRKQAEEQAQQSAAEIRQIFNMLPSLVWKFCPTRFQFVYISDMMAELSGISREAFLENPQIWDDRVDLGNESQEALRISWEAIRKGESYRVIYRFHTLHRGVRWFEVIGRAVDEEGVLYYYGSTTDITECKQAEESLHRLNQELENRVKERTSELEQLNHQLLAEIAERMSVEAALHQREQEYRALVEHAPDIIERFDPQGRHLYVNPAIESVTGKPPNEFIGKTNRELGISEPNLAIWEQALSRVFQTGEEQQFEFSLVTAQGLKYYQTRLVPEMETDGNLISVLGMTRDITDHKLAIEALRESEDGFRQLTENINEVFWMVTPDFSERLYISPAYEQIWGRSCQSLYDQSNSWSEAVHSEDREFLIGKQEQESRGEVTDVEYRIVRPDGSMRWIRDRAFPIYDAQGQVYRIAGIAEDITCRKQAELESYKVLQRERELSMLKSSFVAMTSHEFRTPLTAISSSTDLLERYRNRLSEEKQQAHLHRIKSAVLRMTQMLNDILLMSEAEAGKLQFNPAPLNLVQFCRHLVEDVQPTAKEQQVIHFTYRSDGTIAGQDSDEIKQKRFDFLSGLALWDEKLLRQILGNLLSNALKYSPEGGTVQFDLTAKNDRVIFQIQDQGIGIPPADQSRLFEAFHRANNVGTIQGTGLGLAIVKQCLDLHRGEITFTSEVGKGTRFIITLPLS